jgi:hypothetical protein
MGREAVTLAMLVSLRPLAHTADATSARYNPARASASASADATRRRSSALARPRGVHLAEPLGRAGASALPQRKEGSSSTSNTRRTA